MLFLQQQAFGWERTESTADDTQELVSVSIEGEEVWRARVGSRYERLMTSADGNLIVLAGSERLPERDTTEEFHREFLAFFTPTGTLVGTSTDEGARVTDLLIDPNGSRVFYRVSTQVRAIDVTRAARVEPDAGRLRQLSAYPDSTVARAARGHLPYLTRREVPRNPGTDGLGARPE